MTAVTRWTATKAISVFADGSELWVGVADLRFLGILTEYSARRQRWRLDNFGIRSKDPHPRCEDASRPLPLRARLLRALRGLCFAKVSCPTTCPWHTVGAIPIAPGVGSTPATPACFEREPLPNPLLWTWRGDLDFRLPD